MAPYSATEPRPIPVNPPSRRRWYALLPLALGWLSSAARADSAIEGTALYLQRLALPPGVEFEAVLEDISAADAPAEPLGRTRLPDPGNPPIHFRIPYDPGRIVPNHRYTVRASLRLGERLLFTTDRIYPVLTQGHGRRVSLLLRRAQGGAAPRSTPLGALPASFLGELPCADCPGIDYQLDLFPDGVFFARRDYRERGVRVDDIGRWSLTPDGRHLNLQGREAGRFAVLGPGLLGRPDLPGQPEAPRYGLKRADTFRPIEPHLELTGQYSYWADAGWFTECQTGLRLPVAQEGANAALEAAYGKAHTTPGETLMTSIRGTIAPRPKQEGEGQERMLVVERFSAFQPGPACAPTGAGTPLENTRWKLLELRGKPLDAGEVQQPPHILLDPVEHRVAGSGGCNRLLGGYRLAGERLEFRQLAGTMMACPKGMAFERSFHAALAKVRSWKIVAERLELYDGAGTVVARFQADRGA
ncbi:conserved exported protein of unknown function [Candidatus Methylocalor cossyra]|uniref:DUF306 domain-containing protein n=1 Tax=Candidatus Methylocalor cossyra TaxID=3108543 RepID=A0ABM9NI69_9GAMM